MLFNVFHALTMWDKLNQDRQTEDIQNDSWQNIDISENQRKTVMHKLPPYSNALWTLQKACNDHLDN